MPIVLMLQVSAVIIIFALLIILLLFLQPGSNKIEAQKNRAKAKNTYDNICILLYNTINKIYMVNNFIQSIYNMYKSIYIIKEEKAKQKTGNFIIVEILTIILSVSISLIYFKDLLITTAVTLIISTLVYQKLIGDGSIFLSCLNETISDIVHIYNAEGGNIDRMFLKLLKNEDYITPYLEQMYIYLKKAILSKDATYINEYIRISPSRYLRLIFNCIYMTMKFGDDTDNNNIKLFNKNMMAIQREINSEEVKIQKIKDAVFMEIFFIIMPIFILPIADWYMREFFVFDFVQNFLNGSIGYIVKISAVIVSYLCFYIYNKLIRINLPLEASGKIPWEEDLIKTKHWVDKLITKIAPKKDTKREQRVKSLIIFSTGVANIKPLYLKRIMCGVTVLIFSIILVITDTQITKISILNNIYSGLNKEIMDTVISVHDDSNEYVKQSISNDKYVINVIKRAFKKEYENAEDKQIFVEDIIKSDNLNYGQYNEIAAQRINSKISLLSKIDIKIIIVAVIVLFLIGYNLPYLDLIISKLLSKSTIAYDELLGCYTTVLILITYKASNVKMLIEWLSSFTVLYRFKFQRVLDYLNKESVMELNQEIRYKPLNNLLECIVLAINGLSMKDAFAGIEQQYIFQEERRSITNEKTIKFRQGIIQLLSWLSMGYMFGIYVMFPLIMSVVDMMKILE